MKNFLDWINEAKYTSFNVIFGVGNIVYKALKKYCQGNKPLKCGCDGYMDNGNGSLMRILPFTLYCIYNNLDLIETKKIIDEASSLTHANEISKMGCYMYTEFLRAIVNNKSKDEALKYIQSLDYSSYKYSAQLEYNRILKNNFMELDEKDIKESGYIVDTLEAALYSIMHSNDYKETIMTAVNLGYDTDTVAGIAGSIAGIQYGLENVPASWISKLKKYYYLVDMADNFSNALIKKKIDVNDLESKII